MLSRFAAAAFTFATLGAVVVPSLAAAQSAPAPQGASASAATTWKIDKTHSELTFVIRHFMSRVRGTFRQWEGTVAMADPAKWETASVDVAIQTASVFTDNERRDAHLRTSDFFLADSFPAITFRSTKVERQGDAAKIHGNLTIRGVTKPVVLTGRFLGLQRSPNGAERMGFEAATTINRLDYGVKWNRAAEGGGVTLGDEVTIEIAVEATRAPAPRS